MRVHDNGVGMTKDEIAFAMQPFHQLDTAPRKQTGTGLGLPVTKALVDANRARLMLYERARRRHLGAGPDHRGGQDCQGADRGADGHRGDGLPEAQAEQDRKGAENHVRPGEVRAEEHRADRLRGRGVAGLFGQVFDARGFDRADAVLGGSTTGRAG